MDYDKQLASSFGESKGDMIAASDLALMHNVFVSQHLVCPPFDPLNNNITYPFAFYWQS